MRSASWAAFGAVLVSIVGGPVHGQDLAKEIVGVWKLAEFVRRDPATGAGTNVLGEKPVGYLIYSKQGRVFAFLVGSDRKAPASPEPTDAERADLFKSLIGYTGEYRVEGGKVVVKADASWIQSWTGVERVQEVEIKGDSLTISATVKSPRDGKELRVSNTWVRVE